MRSTYEEIDPVQGAIILCYYTVLKMACQNLVDDIDDIIEDREWSNIVDDIKVGAVNTLDPISTDFDDEW